MADRALISINAPNFLTIGLMGVGFFILLAALWQVASRFLGQQSATEETPVTTGGSFVPG